MLNPRCFQRLGLDEDNRVVVLTNPLLEGMQFRVTGYAQVNEYVLVQWEQSDGQEAITGESLYQGITPIATSGGFLPLYEPTVIPVQSSTPETRTTAASQLNTALGKFGVPPVVAIALRNPINSVFFQK